MTDCGALTIRVPSGTCTTGPPPEGLFVLIRFPPGLCGSTTSVECSRSDKLEWGMSKEVALKQYVTATSRLQIELVKYNVVSSNVKIGSAELSLEPLARGEEINVELPIAGLQGQGAFKVKINCIWKNAPGDAINRAQGSADPAVAAAAAGNALTLMTGGGGGGPASGGAAGPAVGGGRAAVALPDPTGQTYNVRVKVHRVQGLQALQLEQDPYDSRVVISVGGRTWKTEVVKKTNSPTFNEDSTQTFEKVDATFFQNALLVQVNEYRLMLPDKRIGIVQFDLASIYRSNADHALVRKWFVLCRDVGDGTVMGYAKLSVCVSNARSDPVIEFEDDDEDDETDEKDEDIIANLVYVPGAIFEELHIHAHCYRAHGLPRMDAGPNSSIDAYVMVQIGNQKRRTDAVENTYEPRWETNVVVPSLMPLLTDTLTLQIWDRDVSSPDDLCSTNTISLASITGGRAGNVPSLFPRWFTAIGHPRAADADYDKHYMAMAKGHKRGVDYRGRFLIGFTGTKTKQTIPMPAISACEHIVTVAASVEVLQLSQVPTSGKLCVRASIAGAAAKSPEREVAEMVGDRSGGRAAYAAFCGNVLTVEVKLPVIVPPQTAEDAFFVQDMGRGDRWALAVWQQIPPLIVHLVPASLGSKIGNLLASTGDEEPTAAVVLDLASMLNEQGGCGAFMSATMLTMADASKTSDGAPPSNPLIQLNAAVRITDGGPTGGSNPVLLQMIGDSTRAAGLQRQFLAGGAQPAARELTLEMFVYHARNIPAGDSNGLSDPYVVVSWANARGRTGWMSETLNPVFNEVLLVPARVYEPQPNILIELWDHDDIGRDTFLCSASIACADLNAAAGHDDLRWITNWTDARGDEVPGCGLLVSMHRNATNRASYFKKTTFRRGQDTRRTYDGLAIPEANQLQVADHRLDLDVLSLRNMRRLNLRAVRQPTVLFELYGRRIETSAADESLMINGAAQWTLPLPVLTPEQRAKAKHASVKDGILPHLSISVRMSVLGMDTLVAVATLPLDSESLSPERKAALEQQAAAECDARLKELMRAHVAMEEDAFAEDALRNGGELSLIERQGLLDDDEDAGAPHAVVVSPSGASGLSERDGKNLQQQPSGERSRSIVTTTTGARPSAAAAAAADSGITAQVSPTPGVGETTDDPSRPLIVQHESGGGSGPGSDYHQLTTPRVGAASAGAAAAAAAAAASGLSAGGDALTATALTRLEKMRVDLKIATALEGEDEREKALSDVTSTASSEPDELLWYERFEVECFDSDFQGRVVRPHERVARFGRLGRKSAAFHGTRTTAEQVLGPFTDGRTAVQLYRGSGASGTLKAGTLILDATLQRIGATTVSAAAAAAAASRASSSSSAKPASPFTPLAARKKTPFLCRAYIVNCRDLSAMDSGILGKASDPYVVLKLSASATAEQSDKDIVVACKDQIRYQVLNPDFFFMRELPGEFPLHCNLRVAVFDWDRLGSDELIGFTDINLEERYYSKRGYNVARVQRDPAVQLENENPAAFYGLNHYGSYTEKRLLRNESGLSSGTIELWVDVFDFSNPVPRPIDIAPPPPVPMELRVIVWNVRDCELTEESLMGELMTDIYVRCNLEGVSSQQNTDTHYRSLDGSGSFNWRMTFPIVFDPRLKKIYSAEDLLESATGGGENGPGAEAGGAASTAVKHLFSVRKEAKKCRPRLQVQLWDNDLLPLSDDYIGSASLDLLNLVPAYARRHQHTLVSGLTNGCRTCGAKVCGRCSCCPDSCQPDVIASEIETLKERQEYARAERQEEKEARRRQIQHDVDSKMQALEGKLSVAEMARARQKLERAAKKASRVNVFRDFMPQRTKESRRVLADMMYNEQVQMRKRRLGPNEGVAGLAAQPGAGEADGKNKRAVAELTRQWFTCRGSNGGCRCGDVQLSFELVPLIELRRDENLRAGKGRSAPQQLPEPDRPDSSFFWLSSPWKSAVHILWKNYKWHLLVLILLVSGIVFAYVYLDTGVRVKAEAFFK